MGHIAPDPSEIFHRAVDEGERRLDQTLLELTSTGFIAGFTIVFGIVGLGIVRALLEPDWPGVAKVASASALGIGLTFLIVGRAELFSENFFDPVATVFRRRRAALITRLLRLWALTFAFNLVGGILLAYVMSIDGVLPAGTSDALATIAAEIARQAPLAAFAKAIVGGALVALLSHMLSAVNGIGSRIALAFFVGFLLALAPFDHVIVTTLHLIFGVLFGADIGYRTLLETMAIATAGNLVGGIGLTTLSHIGQVEGARQSH